MSDLEHSFSDNEDWTPKQSEDEPKEPTGDPEGEFESEEEKQAFLKEVEDTLRGTRSEEGEGNPETVESQFLMGLTPMGTVGIRINDENGDSVNYFISDPTEAWEIAGHLQSLATIMVQTRYAMAMQEQRMVEEMMKKQDLYVPGHGKIS